MRIIAESTLKAFWEVHPKAQQPLRAWVALVRRAEWKSMADVKAMFATASVIDATHVVFDIGGNKYRLLVDIWFDGQRVYTKRIGTHEEYDDWDLG